MQLDLYCRSHHYLQEKQCHAEQGPCGLSTDTACGSGSHVFYQPLLEWLMGPETDP